MLTKSKITTSLLVSKQACDSQVNLFSNLWPEGLTLPKSERLQLKLASKLQTYNFDLYWTSTNLLTDEQRAEYYKAIAPAWAAYNKDLAPAKAEYLKDHAPTWAEYEKVLASAWAEYVKARAPAKAEYDKVEAPAKAEYEKTCWLQIIKLLIK